MKLHRSTARLAFAILVAALPSLLLSYPPYPSNWTAGGLECLDCSGGRWCYYDGTSNCTTDKDGNACPSGRCEMNCNTTYSGGWPWTTSCATYQYYGPCGYDGNGDYGCPDPVTRCDMSQFPSSCGAHNDPVIAICPSDFSDVNEPLGPANTTWVAGRCEYECNSGFLYNASADACLLCALVGVDGTTCQTGGSCPTGASSSGGMCSCNSGYTTSGNTCVCASYSLSGGNSNLSSCPSNSSTSGCSCTCNSGYTACGATCVANCGGSHQSLNSSCNCVCNSGYTMCTNSTCGASSSPPSNGAFNTSSCGYVCNSGYTMCNNGTCGSNSCGSNQSFSASTCSCVCNSGYTMCNGSCTSSNCSSNQHFSTTSCSCVSNTICR